MKGKNHLRMGACTVGAVSAVGLVPFAQAPAAVAVGIGLFMFAKVAPDLDHKSSSITRSWGPITWLFTRGVVMPVAWFAYRASATPADRPKPVIHRGFTHTLPGGFVAALATGVTILQGPTWTAVCLALMVGGAARVYKRSWQVYAAVVAGFLGYAAWTEVAIATPWLVVVMAVGCYAHAIDDCVTTAGAPLAWPLRDERGRRWGRKGTPEWMRFDTGSGVETAVVWAAIIATSGLVYWLVVAPWLAPLLVGSEAVG